MLKVRGVPVAGLAEGDFDCPEHGLQPKLALGYKNDAGEQAVVCASCMTLFAMHQRETVGITAEGHTFGCGGPFHKVEE